MTGLNSKRAGRWAIWALILLCAALTAADFMAPRHGTFPVEEVPVFYGWYGLFACIGLALAAKIVAPLLRRAEDYYAPLSTASEEHPAVDLGQENADA